MRGQNPDERAAIETASEIDTPKKTSTAPPPCNHGTMQPRKLASDAPNLSNRQQQLRNAGNIRIYPPGKQRLSYNRISRRPRYQQSQISSLLIREAQHRYIGTKQFYIVIGVLKYNRITLGSRS
jgi:hypothetical protein